MGKQQSHNLTQFHIDLHNNVSEFVGSLQGAHREMASEISRRIHDLGAAREKMGDRQRQYLEEFHSDLCRDVNDFVGDLEEAHADRASEISRRIHDLGAAREKMGAELRQDLEEFYQDLCRDVDEFISDIEEAHRNRASEISQRMHDLGAARDEMSAEQRQRLAEEHARLETTVNQMRSEKKREVDAEKILACLRPLVHKSKTNCLLADRMILNAAFLLSRSRSDDFDRTIGDMDSEMGDRCMFKYVGPVPPYNFVNIIISWDR